MKPIDIEQEKKLTSWKNCHHCPALFFMCHPLTTLCDLSSTLLPPPRPHAVLRTLKNSMSKTSSDAFSSALYLWSTWYIEHRLLLNKLLLKIEASSFGLPDIALSWFPHSLTWALLCNFPCFSLHFIFFFNFYFVLEHSGLIMLQKFQVNNIANKGANLEAHIKLCCPEKVWRRDEAKSELWSPRVLIFIFLHLMRLELKRWPDQSQMEALEEWDPPLPSCPDTLCYLQVSWGQAVNHVNRRLPG